MTLNSHLLSKASHLTTKEDKNREKRYQIHNTEKTSESNVCRRTLVTNFRAFLEKKNEINRSLFLISSSLPPFSFLSPASPSLPLSSFHSRALPPLSSFSLSRYFFTTPPLPNRFLPSRRFVRCLARRKRKEGQIAVSPTQLLSNSFTMLNPDVFFCSKNVTIVFSVYIGFKVKS